MVDLLLEIAVGNCFFTRNLLNFSLIYHQPIYYGLWSLEDNQQLLLFYHVRYQVLFWVSTSESMYDFYVKQLKFY